jgi:hypothetical protein
MWGAARAAEFLGRTMYKSRVTSNTRKPSSPGAGEVTSWEEKEAIDRVKLKRTMQVPGAAGVKMSCFPDQVKWYCPKRRKRDGGAGVAVKRRGR